MTNSRMRVIIVLLSVLIKSLLSNPAGSSLEHEAGKCGGEGGEGEGGGGVKLRLTRAFPQMWMFNLQVAVTGPPVMTRGPSCAWTPA